MYNLQGHHIAFLLVHYLYMPSWALITLFECRLLCTLPEGTFEVLTAVVRQMIEGEQRHQLSEGTI